MAKGYKEKLSEHVENIFKGFTTPGIHICDIATGGGKSYTIGKLTCEYYTKYFDRIIILCVQNKLVEGMNREIVKFLGNSLIKPKDIIIIENNPEVIIKAVKNKSFSNLLDEIDDQVRCLEQKGLNSNDLRYSYNRVKKIYDGVSALVTTYEYSLNNDFIHQQIEDAERNLRWSIRHFFEEYKNHIEHSNVEKIQKVSLSHINNRFPSLVKVYPQVEFERKKVVLMTVHKAMYGVDPILSDKIKLSNFTKKNKKTLIFFDESDQAAIAMRNAIIDQSLDESRGSNRFSKGYKGYLQYKTLLENPSHIANDYYGEILEKSLYRAQSVIDTNWGKMMGDIEPFKSIFLSQNESIEDYRRGVFFCGPTLRLNISQSNDNSKSYICYQKGERNFRLVHSESEESLNSIYAKVIPLDQFLTLLRVNVGSVKSQFGKVVRQAYENSKDKHDKDISKITNNSFDNYLGYPTMEKEIHTFFSRLEPVSESMFEQQLTAFLTNRKNPIVTKDNFKLSDNTVYTQGVQLYQEELDDRDNQHRVRLSCREINVTPEKILLDLSNFENTSVVLCSATASCKSVVSNFDIAYLKQILNSKVHEISRDVRKTFDSLVSELYPKEHRIEAIPLKTYVYSDPRENKLALPNKYKEMFSAEAQSEGLAEKWFLIAHRNLKKLVNKESEVIFHLNRLFQFIETYHWFINHDDVHSMIFFQNRTGDKDLKEYITLSCLIDGSFSDMPSSLDVDIPDDWINEHLFVSKDLEEVENSILTKLGNNKDSKIMLVSAYGSFKAGTNLQYTIPDGLNCLLGENWEIEGERLKKDWDAMYLQSPTGYLVVSEDGTELTSERSLYNAMLVLMMLFERGCLSKEEVKRWLYKTFTKNFYFNGSGINKDKAAWAQTILEQAVGRLCRTHNKPSTTYILYDEAMAPFFDESNMDKSLTKEFKALVESIKCNSAGVDFTSTEEMLRCNNANRVQFLLNRLRDDALHFTPHKKTSDEDYEDEDEEQGNDIGYRYKAAQIKNQSYKQMIIRKPVIMSFDELTEEDRYLPFAEKCYGDWERDENGGYYFSYDKKYKKILPARKDIVPFYISPQSVRLDILLKNNVIYNYFKKHGYATKWDQNGLILHPQILRSEYAGEIGEEAFKALLLHYTDCDESSIRHLEDKDYEIADFVICNSDGSYKIAFDVKNMNPNADHNDKFGDMSTTEKRQEKLKKLGCKLVTVNMLQLPNDTIDLSEIGGLIDNDGIIIPNAIETLKSLVNN